MREARAELAALDVDVLVVGTAAAWQAKALMDAGMPFPCVVDPDHNLYRALGLRRLRPHEWFRPELWRNYALAWRRGARQGKVTGDVRQLPGVVIVTPDRRVRWLHRARTIGDYPPVATVLTRLAEITRPH